MTMLILGIFIGANLGLIVGALCCASGKADESEPVSLDGMQDVFTPDPTMGAARMQSWRKEGVF